MELDKNTLSERQVIVSWAPSTVYQNLINSAGPFAEVGGGGGGPWHGSRMNKMMSHGSQISECHFHESRK